jgi:hypothetical protein
MVELLSEEAMKDGVPLTESDKKILASESSERSCLEPMPEALRRRVKELIVRIFQAEPFDEFDRDPKCFSCSMQWVDDDGRYPNIVALAEEVVRERQPASLSGWKLVKDKLLLWGCGLLVVLLMLAIVAGAGFLFDGK